MVSSLKGVIGIGCVLPKPDATFGTETCNLGFLSANSFLIIVAKLFKFSSPK